MSKLLKLRFKFFIIVKVGIIDSRNYEKRLKNSSIKSESLIQRTLSEFNINSELLTQKTISFI